MANNSAWTNFADYFTDPETWDQVLKMLGGLGGTSSKQAWDELSNIVSYYKNPDRDTSVDYNTYKSGITGSDEISGVTDLVPGLNGIMTYVEDLMTTVGEENALNRDFNSTEAAAQRTFTAEENEKNRQFQLDMRNSAYQDSVKDLKAAGLNPILAATNGATTTPTGVVGAGNSASYNVGGGDTFSGILQSIGGIASAISDFLPAGKAVKLMKAIGFRA